MYFVATNLSDQTGRERIFKLFQGHAKPISYFARLLVFRLSSKMTASPRKFSQAPIFSPETEKLISTYACSVYVCTSLTNVNALECVGMRYVNKVLRDIKQRAYHKASLRSKSCTIKTMVAAFVTWLVPKRVLSTKLCQIITIEHIECFNIYWQSRQSSSHIIIECKIINRGKISTRTELIAHDSIDTPRWWKDMQKSSTAENHTKISGSAMFDG